MHARRVGVLLLMLGLAATLTSTATAAPGDPLPGGEGGNPTLAAALESTNRAYLDAQAALERSKQRQRDLAQQLAGSEARLAELQAQVDPIAATAYRSGPMRTASVLLNSDSAASMLDRAAALDTITRRADRLLRELGQAQAQTREAKAAVDAEVTEQQAQLAAMAKKKQEAEKALAIAGGRATGGFVSATSPLAKPAPRRADGSWATESCIVDDPTTSGCITARTLHALQQAKNNGFTRFVSCWRPPGEPYEHPKGRACDYSVQPNGFGGVASGDNRLYGNNLAAFFVRNASNLGVLYVIWFKQIWTPASGWRRYDSGNGDPSSDHTNHVHLSLY